MFKILSNSGRARTGRLKTKYNIIDTPVFMPVGTLASVKGITKEDLDELEFSIIL